MNFFVSFRAEEGIWIGLKGHKDSHWGWSDGSLLGTWAVYYNYPWKSSDPNGGQSVNCIRLIKEDEKYVGADRTYISTFGYLCSKYHEPGSPVKSSFVSLLYDNIEWEFLMNRDSTQCLPLKPREDNNLIQTLVINQLPSSSDEKVKLILYFDSEISCDNFNIFMILTPNCSSKNYYQRCFFYENTVASESSDVCSYSCPIRIVEDKVVISLITNPLHVFPEGTGKLCELEIIYSP